MECSRDEHPTWDGPNAYTPASVPDALKLDEEVRQATEAYAVAQKNLEAARSAECAATNRLNKAQKAFDQYVAERRKQAPRGSDWNRPAGGFRDA